MSLEKPPNSGFHSFWRAQHKIRYALRLHIIKSVSVYSVAGAVVKVVALALALSKHRVCRHARGASVWVRRVPWLNGRRDRGYEQKIPRNAMHDPMYTWHVCAGISRTLSDLYACACVCVRSICVQSASNAPRRRVVKLCGCVCVCTWIKQIMLIMHKQNRWLSVLANRCVFERVYQLTDAVALIVRVCVLGFCWLRLLTWRNWNWLT